MNYRKVTAIIRHDVLKKVNRALQSKNIHGISVTRVTEYGEYADFYSKDWMISHARIEIFTTEPQADAIARTIMKTAHEGENLEGDGIVAVLPVEKLYRIRTQSEVNPEAI